MDNKKVLYTIGHSGHSFEYFISLLNKYSINCLVDVRSKPYSKFHKQYNYDNLSTALQMENIHYIFMGKEFGARRNETNLYNSEGQLDFEKTMESELFLSGVERIKTGLSKDYIIALMCAEKNPINCHRSMLVARYFFENGFHPVHILENGESIDQVMIIKLLLDQYYPNRNQVSLIPEENYEDEHELYDKAYRMKNREIGYVMEGNS